ncbi:hypothetical protein NAP1_08090 [Erythrobacter sp. NAP1]|uniref:hypothetical protein n=1 Tax=Erythrobacter sp. NAP1 TaxID=237727 RepID=UPI0000686985|nr:hypothetical protein [Erythrobacter sp. NAP1]EAQ30724.1 hypothetical protein NAP1_08090 [Erythrobacter sp. NAP1]
MRLPFSTSLSTAALAIAAASPVALQAQDSSETVSIRTAEPEIEVTAERPLREDEVRQGVKDIAHSRRPKEAIPRFIDPLCLTVVGLGAELSERVAQRVRTNAQDAGLELGEPDCTANAVIMVVDRPGVLVDRLRRERPQIFNAAAVRDIRTEINRGLPFVAWNIEGVQSRLARSANEQNSGAIAGSGFLFDDAGANVAQEREYGASRFRASLPRTRSSSFIVFDVRQLENVHLNQLADFATLQLLGSPRRNYDANNLAAASILTLFDGDVLTGPQSLTQLDKAYLRGLYTMPPGTWGSRLETYSKRAYEEIAGAEAAREQAAP